MTVLRPVKAPARGRAMPVMHVTAADCRAAALALISAGLRATPPAEHRAVARDVTQALGLTPTIPARPSEHRP